MTDTRALIEQLAQRSNPVRPLASPLQRTLLWAAAACVLIGLVTVTLGLRPVLPAELSQWPTAIGWVASVLTGLLAAYAAFQISVPGRSPSWAWLPLFPLVLWLIGLGLGCLREFATIGAAALVFQSNTGECARVIIAMSVPLGVSMLLMVRHAGVLRPGPTAMLAALAAAALSSAGVSLVHRGENGLMVLLWHFGVVVVLSLVCLLAGRRLFSWIGHARPSKPAG